MGFGDILGDTWDAVADTGAASLGVAMDVAKASTEAAHGRPFSAQRAMRSSFNRRRTDFLSDHKTLAALSARALQVLGGGLYALSLPAHAEMRTLSAGALYTGLPGNHISDKGMPSLKDAWKASDKVSLGQAVMMNVGDKPKGMTYRNAWKYGDKNEKQYDPEFSWSSGTFDALMIFTDPLILAGKAKKGLTVAKEKITPDDIKVVAGKVDPVTRRQKRVMADHESILDATEGTDALQNFHLFSRHGVTNSAGLASVLAQARNDRATRSLVLRHSMGDQDATMALSAQRQDLIDQINRMNEDLDDLIVPEFGTKSHDGLFDSDYWDNPETREQLARQRDESEQLLDTYNRTLGDDERLVSATLPTQDDLGLGMSMVKRTYASKRDLKWMEGQSAYYVQPGVGGIVTRVARSPKNLRPSGWVDFHDADQAVREVDALTKRTPGLHPEQRDDMMNRFIAAPDDNSRKQVLQGIEDDIFAAMGKHYGYEDVDVRELATRFMDERRAAMVKAKQQGTGNVYGFSSKGVAEHDPLVEAQLDNGTWTLPVDHIKKVLYRNAGRYQALKNVSGKAFSITDQMLDFVNDIWRFEALFRAGYPIRNAADAQLRMLAFVGAHDWRKIQQENLGHAVKNDLNQTRRFAGKDATDDLFGVGERKVGEYDLSDAFGATEDEARAVYEKVSSADSVASMFLGNYNDILNQLRGTGRWVSKKGDAEGWEDDYLRVVNQQFRNSAITKRLLSGQSPERVVAWLKSGEGRSIRRRMVFGSDSAEALVLRNIENLNHAVPKEYWRTVHDRALTKDDLVGMWDNVDSRPIINAEQIEHSMGVGTPAELLAKVQRVYFNKVARLTDDQMGRHPLFVSLYRGHQIELMKRLDPKLKGTLELADQRRISEQARLWARREMKSIMFDVSQKSDLGHFVRFIMPFYSAWQDAITKYGRMLMRDPSRLGYLAQAWTAPNDASFMEVTDSDGKIVSAEDSKLSDDEGVVIPQSWAKAVGLPWTPKISKGSFNIALQGDPLWLPGWGPMGTVPINQVIRKTDNATAAKAAEELGILPYGVQDYGKYGLKGFYSGSLRQLSLPEGRKQRMLASVMQDMYFEAARSGKPEPKWKDIKDRYQELLNLRTLTSALSPVSVQYQSPYQFYIDQSHAYDEKVGKPGGFKDFAEADKAFLKDFGEDFYIFRMSMSKTNVGIRPSRRADKAALRVRDLIEAKPKYASLIIGPDNTGEYDRNVYALQAGRKISGTSDYWRDTYSNPKEAIRLNRVEQGWIEYQKISARINSAMEARGLTSLNQSAAADLRQLKHEWIETVAGPGGPEWGQAWYGDYQEFGSASVTDFLDAAKMVVNDDRTKDRGDVQALGVYLAARKSVRKLLQSRYRNNGSASLTAQSNADIAEVWGGLMTQLRQSNVFFEDYWSRYLERDDLTKVVR